jgi:hypothetical protein
MKLTPPTKTVYYKSAVLAVVGFIANIVTIQVLSDFSSCLVVAGYVLFLGNTLKGF